MIAGAGLGSTGELAERYGIIGLGLVLLYPVFRWVFGYFGGKIKAEVKAQEARDARLSELEETDKARNEEHFNTLAAKDAQILDISTKLAAAEAKLAMIQHGQIEASASEIATQIADRITELASPEPEPEPPPG